MFGKDKGGNLINRHMRAYLHKKEAFLRFFGLKSCDTCRKAQRSLKQAGWVPEVVDVRADGLSEADIAAILHNVGDAAVNRASTTWRNLDETERAEAPAVLLARHPTLLKRPVIEQDLWTVGWKADVQKHWLEDTSPKA